jgi:hypothetical protein
MRSGAFVQPPIPWPLPESESISATSIGSGLHALALKWLTEDRLARKKEEAEEKIKKRGARRDVAGSVPSDSETFYRK